MRRRKFLLGAGTTIAFPFVAGCSGVFGNDTSGTAAKASTRTASKTPAQNTEKETAIETSGPEPGDVSAEVVNQKFVSEEHPAGTDYYMTGVVENTGAVPLAGPEVSVEFYDECGRVVGTASAEITHLGKGQFWDVRVEYVGADEDPEPVEGLIEFGTAEPWSTYSRPDELEVVSETLENATASSAETTVEMTVPESPETTTLPLPTTEGATPITETETTAETTTPKPSETTEKPVVTGEVKNTADTSLNAITGFADFVAENGHVLESGETTIDELKSGESTSFEVEYPGFDDKRIERVSDYELYFVL